MTSNWFLSKNSFLFRLYRAGRIAGKEIGGRCENERRLVIGRLMGCRIGHRHFYIFNNYASAVDRMGDVTLMGALFTW